MISSWMFRIFNKTKPRGFPDDSVVLMLSVLAGVNLYHLYFVTQALATSFNLNHLVLWLSLSIVALPLSLLPMIFMFNFVFISLLGVATMLFALDQPFIQTVSVPVLAVAVVFLFAWLENRYLDRLS